MFGKTHTALLANPSLDTEKLKNTAAIYKVLQWWKNVNVKTCGAVSRNNDQYRAPIHDPEDLRLLILFEFGEMAMKMVGKQGLRVKQLSKDTAAAIHQTCYGLVNLCRRLLATSHKYMRFTWAIHLESY